MAFNDRDQGPSLQDYPCDEEGRPRMLENHKPYRGEIADRNAITDCDIALSYLRGSWLYTTQDAAAAVRRVKDYLIEKREEHYEP